MLVYNQVLIITVIIALFFIIFYDSCIFVYNIAVNLYLYRYRRDSVYELLKGDIV